MRALQAQARPLEPGTAVPDADALIASFDRHYKALIGRCSRAYPGAAAALARLKSAGIRLACTTNKNLEFSQALLAAHGLDVHLDLVVGGDTLPCRKPDGRVLQHVASTLGVAPQQLAHVGDSATDIKAARAAGVLAWGVPWGYNGGTPIEASAPDAVFPSLLAVAAHVLPTGSTSLASA
jgi:phosphoglycolate phosphatase